MVARSNRTNITSKTSIPTRPKKPGFNVLNTKKSNTFAGGTRGRAPDSADPPTGGEHWRRGKRVTGPAKTIVFCGSFKFHKDMEKAAAPLRQKGFQVIVPQPSHIRHAHLPQSLKTGKFDQKTLTRAEGQGAYQHLENVRKADIVYIFNKGSYIGPAVTVEIGYSLALKKPIFAKAPIKDITITNFIQEVISPLKLLKFLK